VVVESIDQFPFDCSTGCKDKSARVVAQIIIRTEWNLEVWL